MLLDQILLHVPCPIFWKNLEGVFLGCNKLFLEKILGYYDYSQLIGKKDADLPWGSYKDDYAKDDQEIISSGNTVTRIETIPLKTGTIISETTKTPLIQDGKVIGVLGICLDITDRLEKERLIIENKTHLMEKEHQKKFINFISKLQHDIEAYRVEAINDITPCITPADQQISLTRQESQILYYLSLNKSPREIAAIISKIEKKTISSSTVQSIIIKQLYLKFGVYSISQLMDKATMLNQVPFMLQE